MQTSIRIFIFLIIVKTVTAFENHEANEDAAAFQWDTFLNYPNQYATVSSDHPYSRISGFSFFPLTSLAGHDLMGSAEFSVLPRNFYNQDIALNGSVLQSYGLGLGYQSMFSDNQVGFVYGLFGIDGDMAGMGSKNIYGDLSYTHKWNLTRRLILGAGIDLHFYFRDFFPYPLILLDWQVAEHTKIKANFDTGEIKQFLSKQFNVFLGAQYDIFHYGFSNDYGYVSESTSSMVGVEYCISQNVFARLSAKKPFWMAEKVWPETGKEIGITNKDGVSIRLQIAYGT